MGSKSDIGEVIAGAAGGDVIASGATMSSAGQKASAVAVLAFYKFADFPDCAALKPVLAAFCCARGIRGTFILAPEGINGTVAGTAKAIAELSGFFAVDPIWGGRLAGAEAKLSSTAEMPFLRMKVRLKSEIVTLRSPEADPRQRTGMRVAPADWNALIARPDVVIVDARNDYEVQLGSFVGARNPKTAHFTEFRDFAARELDPARDRKVAMFCTGGIRCEKASALLLAQGFEEVFQLDGGILAYLAEMPAAASRFRGECFVFDERVALGQQLAPGEATLCRACRMPLSAADRQHADYVEGQHCHHCAGVSHARAFERHRQMELAAARGEAHLGDDAVRTAADNRRSKELRRRGQAGDDHGKVLQRDGRG